MSQTQPKIQAEQTDVLDVSFSPITSYTTTSKKTKSHAEKRFKKFKKCVYFSVGFILLIFSIQLFILPKLIMKIFHQHINSALIFNKPKPNDHYYRQWKSNTIKHGTPILFTVKFFNITNPNKILTNSEIPQLNITPPIVYDAWYNRTNISFSDKGNLVSQNLIEWFVYNPKLSKIKENENYTIMSPIIGLLWYHLNNNNNFINKYSNKIIEKLLNKINKLDPISIMFWSGTAHKLIWDVYNFNVEIQNLTNFNFSWGLMYNFSHQFYTTYTGNDIKSKMSEILQFGKAKVESIQKSAYISCWDPPVPISPAKLFYFGVNALHDKKSIDPMWVSVIYRGLDLDYRNSVKYRGLPLYSYMIQLSPQLDNVSQTPSNAQFYQYGPSGVMNLTKCYGNIPTILSMEGFYGAPDYAKNNSLFGLPNASNTNPTYINVEPHTGAIIQASAGMQLSFPIHSLPVNGTCIDRPRHKCTNESLQNIPDDLMVPVYLINFGVNVSHHTVDDMNDNLTLVKTLRKSSKIAGIISCILFCIWLWITFYLYGNRKNKSRIDKLISNNTKENEIDETSTQETELLNENDVWNLKD